MWRLGILIPLLGGAVPTSGTLRVTQHPGELQVTTGGTVALRCQVEVAESEALLRMEWVQGNDSGRYLCRVTLEIPWHGSATGNGTELRVTPAALGGHQAALCWGLLGGLGGTALLLGLALLAHRCCHRCRGAVPSDTANYLNVVSLSARDPAKLPPAPELKISPYQRGLQRARGPPVPPRP